jgi:hypothetical protein
MMHRVEAMHYKGNAPAKRDQAYEDYCGTCKVPYKAEDRTPERFMRLLPEHAISLHLLLFDLCKSSIKATLFSPPALPPLQAVFDYL